MPSVRANNDWVVLISSFNLIFPYLIFNWCSIVLSTLRLFFFCPNYLVYPVTLGHKTKMTGFIAEVATKAVLKCCSNVWVCIVLEQLQRLTNSSRLQTVPRSFLSITITKTHFNALWKLVKILKLPLCNPKSNPNWNPIILALLKLIHFACFAKNH